MRIIVETTSSIREFEGFKIVINVDDTVETYTVSSMDVLKASRFHDLGPSHPRKSAQSPLNEGYHLWDQ